jgi:hypothetical protein
LEEDYQLLSLVHLADALALLVGAGVGSDGLMYSLNFEVLKETHIIETENDLESIYSDMIDLSKTIEEMANALTGQG